MSAEAAVAYCEKIDHGSTRFHNAVYRLACNPTPASDSYIGQLAASGNRNVRFACYLYCERSKRDLLKDVYREDLFDHRRIPWVPNAIRDDKTFRDTAMEYGRMFGHE